jgi:hypothetical protein
MSDGNVKLIPSPMQENSYQRVLKSDISNYISSQMMEYSNKIFHQNNRHYFQQQACDFVIIYRFLSMEEQGNENRVIRSELPPVSQHFQNLYTICLAFIDL